MANSFQRPGAVINLTVKEFEDPKKEIYSGGDMWVVRVRRHKTQLQGSANLLLTESLMIEAYEVVPQGAQAAHLGYRSDQPVFSTGQHGQEDRGSFKEI